MILANVAAAEQLERARHAAGLSCPRRAGGGKAPCAARVPGDPRHLAAQDRRAAAGGLQPHPRSRAGPRHREARQRDRAAQPGPGRIRRRELRPFRAQSAPLRPLHLADPALCRPDRAPGPDPRPQTRRRRPSQWGGCALPGRDRGEDFRRRTARHGGRARDRRPPDRAPPRRPHRRDLLRATSAASPAPACSSSSTIPAPTDSFRRPPSATSISATTSAPMPWSATTAETTHRLGDPVSVRLVEAAPVAGALRFELLSGGSAGASSGRARPSHPMRRGKPRRQDTHPHDGDGAKKRRPARKRR